MPPDSGLISLITIAGFHGIAADAAQLKHGFSRGPAFSDEEIQLAAGSLGMKTRILQQPFARLGKAPLPAIAKSDDGRYFIVAKIEHRPARQSGNDHAAQRDNMEADVGLARILIQHANEPVQIVDMKTFAEQWSGWLILFTSKASFAGEVAKFDFTWFIPSVIKYRRLLAEILAISLVLQIIALITPMFFQVIMDKVLVNHAMKTLDVIVIGLVCAVVFEVVLTGIRSYVFSHTSSKIDIELGARLFRHVLALPLSYFETRRVGDSVARIRELENIRAFLTGNAITVLLDLSFSFVFFAVMFAYSLKLTLVVAASLPCYFILTLAFTPLIRRRLDIKFSRNAENQSFLVETISGIDTVKALAIEPRWQQSWEKQLAGYVTAGLSATVASTVASNGVTLIGKLTTVGILWIGANLALAGDLTVGELVAFNMLASQVSMPVLRLAQLWNDFQQVGISMRRLGDVLNAPTELGSRKSRIPKLQGAIDFVAVSFRYRPDMPEVIRNLHLRICPGEVIGIVGRSGSGKSTLTKLVQRLYVPDCGRVMVDGHDLALVDAASLRRQIGVVLQENMLFARSIRENIAVTAPACQLEAVVAAATLAGAHEFICELPEGYDTIIGEFGNGLSGGQRQRIAIARALLTNPRILIFDEATSALDYESESIIQNNMRRISQGRTVLIIAHRLSTVRHADRIVVLERGEIIETGSHAELMTHPGGLYAQLHQLQSIGSQAAGAAQ
ncbi:type I secretion system permease/ATPase [Duganella sp. FT27W]|nr:type I secretion system permease/ATPase [Duganella sp. FT27W]